MKPLLALRRLGVLMPLLVLAACGTVANAPLTPGAAACSVASQVNPAKLAPGLGGSGAPVARGPDPGGIGGTGGPVVAGEKGLGGTGIVGVVTGFASICVNGVEVGYDAATPVERDGEAASLSALEVGQLVALQATGEGDQLRASRVAVIDAAVGPLTAVDPLSGRFAVMGQPSVALEKSDLKGLSVGDWVRVSGQRVNSGEIRATRVQRAITPAKAFVSGVYSVAGGAGLAVGGTPLTVTTLPAGLREGQEVGVSGDWEAGRLRVREWRIRPTRQAIDGAREVLLQGYIHGLNGGELQLGYESLKLGDKVQVHGGNLQSLRVDQSVQVRARVDEQQRLTVQRIELRSEGRRGEFVRSATAVAAPAAAPAASTPSTTGGASGSSGGTGSVGSHGGSGGDSGRGRGAPPVAVGLPGPRAAVAPPAAVVPRGVVLRAAVDRRAVAPRARPVAAARRAVARRVPRAAAVPPVAATPAVIPGATAAVATEVSAPCGDCHGPPGRQQPPHLGPRIAVVQQPDHAVVLLRADDPAGRLHDLHHAGKQVGGVVAVAGQDLQALAHALVVGVDLRHAQGGDEGAHQPIPGQVDAFAEHTAQHGETDAMTTVDETCNEGVAVGLGHAPGL